MLVRVARPPQRERLRHGQPGRPRHLLLTQVPDPPVDPHRAAVRGQLTGQHPDERGLAGTVGAGHQQPLATEDAQRRHVQPVADPHVREFGQHVHRVHSGLLFRRPGLRRGARPGGEDERVGRWRDRVVGQPLDPFLGVADPAHRAVAATPGPERAGGEHGQRQLARDRVQPRHVGLDQSLVAGQVGAPLLVLPQPPAALGRLGREVAVVAVAVTGHRASVNLQDRGGEVFQEHPVVGHGDHRAGVLAQVRLQPGHGLVVQVVGGLVQQQQFRGGGQRGGQRQPGPLATGQRAQGAVPRQPGQAEPVQCRVHPGVGLVAAPGLVAFDQCGVVGQRPAQRRAGGRAQAGFCLPQLGFQLPQVGEGEVDGVLDGGLGRQVQRLRQVPGCV